MNTHALSIHPLFSLRNVFLFDAATCALMGVALLVGAAPLSSLFSLPAALLQYAGLALLPIAAFLVWVGTRRETHRPGAWMVIAGNAGWVVASVGLLVAPWFSPNLLGQAFVLAQAAAVAALAAIEVAALHRS